MGKTLIAVYSQTGQSMHIAHILQKKISADIYEIIPDHKYNDDMWKAWDEAQEEIKTNTYPGLTNAILIISPYPSINHQLQKLEAFQSVHHVTFILCYTVLYNFLGLRCRFGRHRADVHRTSCALVFALIRVRKH